jgi:hypothetical protein
VSGITALELLLGLFDQVLFVNISIDMRIYTLNIYNTRHCCRFLGSIPSFMSSYI